MEKTNTKYNYLLIFSVLYLIFPVIIYYLTFVKIWFCLIGAIAIIFIWFNVVKYKHHKSEKYSSLLTEKRSKVIFIFTLILILIWLIIFGVGNFNAQQYDYIKHNTVIKDMALNDWPFAYNTKGTNQPFVYYFAYYVPAALTAKIICINAASITLLIWTFLGVTIGICWIFKIFNKISLWPIIVLIMFGGIDCLGFLIMNGYFPICSDTLELWAKILQFSSISSTLNCVPHMFSSNIVVTPMLLHYIKKNEINYCLYLSLSCLPLWGPFILVGVIPFFIYYIIKLIKTKNNIWIVFNPWAVIPCLYITIIPSLYLLSNSQASGSYLGFIWDFSNDENLILLLPLILIIEFSLPLTIIFVTKKQQFNNKQWNDFSIITICIIVLIFCEIIHIGYWNDFCMRVSMPSILIIAIYFMQSLHILTRTLRQDGKLLKISCAIIALLCMNYTTFNEATVKIGVPALPIEEYSSPNLAKYIFPYQYMAPDDDSFYQKYISNDLYSYDTNTPRNKFDYTGHQVLPN